MKLRTGGGGGGIWGKLPITLATIPFEHGSERKILDCEGVEDSKCASLRKWELKATADELTEYHKVWPVGGNKNLVEYLKNMIKAGKIEIAQHGVFHRYNEFGAELWDDKPDRGRRLNSIAFAAIRDGKEYLEKVFDTKIETFVPPANTIDKTVQRYVYDLGMNLLDSGSICYQNNKAKILSFMLDPASALEKISRAVKGELNPIYRRNGLYLFSAYTYGTQTEYDTAFKSLKNSLDKCGFAAACSHYRTLVNNKDYRGRYIKLLLAISELPDVEVVTANKYYKLLKEKYYE